MSQTVENDSSRLELDRAFRYAVTLAWQDFMKPIEPRSIQVEYVCEAGTPLDHLSVWSARGGGYRDLVCDFWTLASLAHPTGACFEGRYYSDVLAQALLFVMKNQGQFTRPADAGPHGLVLIHPPDADDRTEAATWMKSVQALGLEANLEGASRTNWGQASTKRESLDVRRRGKHVFTSPTRSYPMNPSTYRQRRTRQIILNCGMPGPRGVGITANNELLSGEIKTSTLESVGI